MSLQCMCVTDRKSCIQTIKSEYLYGVYTRQLSERPIGTTGCADRLLRRSLHANTLLFAVVDSHTDLLIYHTRRATASSSAAPQ